MKQNKVLTVGRQFRKLEDLDLLSWEIEEEIRKESYDEGHSDGYGEGHDAGYSEGQGEGQNRVNLLNKKLGEAGRLDDIIKAAGDKAYQESLFAELGL